MAGLDLTDNVEVFDGITCTSIAAHFRAAPWAFSAKASPDHHKFFWINKGAGRVQINGHTRGFAPNSAFYFPAGTVFVFDLTQASAGWIISVPVAQPLAQAMPETVFMQLIGARGDQAALAAICDDIHRETESKSIAAPAAALCHTGLLSVWLARNIPQASPKPTPSQRLMMRFVQLLEMRFASDDGVAEYARALNVTPTHLARVCKATNACSANSLIQDRKLLAAKIKLAGGNDRISSIATQSGFASAAYFTRLFSQKAGTSPRNFRAMAQSEGESARPKDRPLVSTLH